MTSESDRYTYRIIWSAEDEEHVGCCAEFPGLSWLAGTPESALKGIRKVVAEVVEDMQTSGEPIPEAIADRRFSGKFVLRLTPEEHRRLTLEAAEQGVSLNRLVSSRLART